MRSIVVFILDKYRHAVPDRLTRPGHMRLVQAVGSAWFHELGPFQKRKDLESLFYSIADVSLAERTFY